MFCRVCRDTLERMWRPEARLAPKDEDSCHGLDQCEPRYHFGPRAEIPQIDEVFPDIESYVYGHHKDENSLNYSIKAQCIICREFDYPSAKEKKERDLIAARPGYYSVMHVFFSDWKLAVCVHLSQKHTRALLFPEEQIPQDPENWLSQPLEASNREQEPHFNFRFGPSTDSPETWGLIQKWFRECVQSHEACPPPWRSIPWKPTRVLELRHGQSPACFRLVSRSECPYSARYFTLSHCWGTEPPNMTLRLLKSTFHQLSEWQPVDILPKTFRDAVRIAHYFKVSYLWIDRLCIYQDSPEDWRREASSMQDVYRNSLLNVSALGATCGDDGCFFTRIPPQESFTTVGFKLSAEDETKQFRVPNAWDSGAGGPGDWRETFWRDSFAREPLVQRGWVLQERLLAPRVLHFGKGQVFWECRQVQCCETNPITTMTSSERHDREHEERTKDHGGAPLWKRLLGTPPKAPQDPLHQLFSSWKDIVVEYSKCDLTVPGDKLIAVSGLAQEMRNKMQELGVQRHRYLAGLWEEHFLQTVVWSLDFINGEKGRKVCSYRAPSWSWASLDGVIRFPLTGDYDDYLFDASLVAAETQFPSGGDDTGEVTGGSITLNGTLATVHVGKMSDGSPGIVESLQWHSNDKTVKRLSAVEISKRAEMADTLPSVHFDTDDDITDEVYQTMICGVRYTALHDRKRDWYGLMLTRVGQITYRRVGIVWYPDAETPAAQELFKTLPREEIVII